MMVFGTVPDPHQAAAVKAVLQRTEPYFALLMEQGTGKSKVSLDVGANASLLGRAEGMLVVAPNGVHMDWIREQLEEHWPKHLMVRAAWYAAGARKAVRDQYAAVLVPAPGTFRLLTINLEALRHSGYAVAEAFLKSGRMIMVLDESSNIKTPSAQQTRACWRLGKLAAMRLILTGTEVTNGPLDLYAQFQFLYPGLLGCPNFATFKARYAEWRERRISTNNGIRTFQELVRYRNLEELKALVARHSFQVLKSQCMTLPPKIYERRTVILGEEQQDAYDRVRTRLVATFTDGSTVTTLNKLTTGLRLAQITGGFLPLDAKPVPELPIEEVSIWDRLEAGEVRALPNAKLKALEAVIQEAPAAEQIIIWARFRAELAAIAELLKPYGRVACYWGGVNDRNEQAAEFKAGTRRFMVAQPRAGSKGHNWVQGTTVIFYSNSFSYEDRKQAEDRSHRRGQTAERVLYIDLVAEGTIDAKILTALNKKQDVADYFKSPLELLT